MFKVFHEFVQDCIVLGLRRLYYLLYFFPGFKFRKSYMQECKRIARPRKIYVESPNTFAIDENEIIALIRQTETEFETELKYPLHIAFQDDFFSPLEDGQAEETVGHYLWEKFFTYSIHLIEISTSNFTLETLKHEVAHALIRELNIDTPSFLSEGLCHSVDSVNQPYVALNLIPVAVRDLTPYIMGEEDFPDYSEKSCQGFLLVQYLIQKQNCSLRKIVLLEWDTPSLEDLEIFRVKECFPKYATEVAFGELGESRMLLNYDFAFFLAYDLARLKEERFALWYLTLVKAYLTLKMRTDQSYTFEDLRKKLADDSNGPLDEIKSEIDPQLEQIIFPSFLLKASMEDEKYFIYIFMTIFGKVSTVDNTRVVTGGVYNEISVRGQLDNILKFNRQNAAIDYAIFVSVAAYWRLKGLPLDKITALTRSEMIFTMLNHDFHAVLSDYITHLSMIGKVAPIAKR